MIFWLDERLLADCSAMVYFDEWKRQGLLFTFDDQLFSGASDERGPGETLIERPGLGTVVRYDDGPVRQEWENDRRYVNFDPRAYHPGLVHSYLGALEEVEWCLQQPKLPAIRFGYWLSFAAVVEESPGLLHEVVAAQSQDWDDFGRLRPGVWQSMVDLFRSCLPHPRGQCIGDQSQGAYYFSDVADAVLFKLYV